MEFDEILTQVIELLQRQGRLSYGALKRRFHLDDEYLQDLKDELIDAQRVAADEDGKVLVWLDASLVSGSKFQVSGSQPPAPNTQYLEAERRQLTVMFCDLVGSTALSEQLDPEELREVVRAYQAACAEVIGRFDGHIAQHLGDGLLVYFGYPVAHEDDAPRAVRTGLEIVGAIHELPLQNTQLQQPLQVRIGIHTGVVVVGEIGSADKREILALGETPNIAARLQGLAEPNTIVLSAATQRLVQGLFECQDLGPRMVKGISTPLSVYRAVGEGAARSRFEVAVGTGLTPLVGREEELGLLQRRWAQAREGAGQGVLLSGEAGIGKSRLVQELKEQVLTEGATRIEFRCSPYHQNSAFYPLIEHLQRLLQFAPRETPQAKLAKLQQALAAYRFPQADTLPLLAALLSLPHPEGSPLLTLSPQKQKQKTQEVLVAWIIEEAEKAAVYCAWEDLHWADPSSLEVLTLVLDQVPTTRLLVLLTFRPDFTPPWRSRSHLTQLTLNRLGRHPVEAMVETITGGKPLPREVVQQIVAKTDGVPLFVEELTKMVLESVASIESIESVGSHDRTSLHELAIPTTLHDSLMARLDRLRSAKEVAQVGATLGREFSYELLHAVSPLDEATLQQGLRQLVEAELVYQHGLPPQATYLFKHALVQDTAYQSLLKSKRQQYHQQIAHVLEERFPETAPTQPELLAHHYTEAGLIKQAIPYWHQAGQNAVQRSANVEAVSHLTKGLEVLKILPDTPERTQQELDLQVILGPTLISTKGWGAPELEKTYARARELCHQVGETAQLFPVLWGLWVFHHTREELRKAHELGEQLLSLAQSVQDPALLLEAHLTLGYTLHALGEIVPARDHLEQSIALYDPQQHHALAFLYGGADPGMACLSVAAWVLWMLGYPDQAQERMRDAVTLARKLSHSHSLAFALIFAAEFHQFRRERQTAQEQAEALITLSTEQGFPYWPERAAITRGWALAEQGHGEDGIAQPRQGLAAFRARGAELYRSHFLAMLADAYRKVGQTAAGLATVAEALAWAHNNGGRYYEAELYRLKGELTLQQFNVQGSPFKESRVGSAHQKESIAEAGAVGDAHPTKAAEECFLRAIEIARRQQAKSLELRATVSLARLWQQQGKTKEARQLLAEIYNWFTEGFDTADLKEAKAWLEELG